MLAIILQTLCRPYPFMSFFDTIYPNYSLWKCSVAEINPVLSGDLRHNRNCHAYLQQLIPLFNEEVLEVFPKLKPLMELGTTSYNEKTAYGNYYTSALTYLEDHIDLVYPNIKSKEQLKAVDDLIFAIYHNNNHILEDGDWLKALNRQIRPQHSNTEELIAHHLEDSSPLINEQSPKKAESLLNRFYVLFTPNFKPQLGTNIPSVKNHFYQSDLSNIEYRISTQAQRHHGTARISPLFKRWLAINAQRAVSDQEICHIYFNNLGLDRDRLDIPGSNEKELTHALHQLEEDSSLKIAVITLPASKGLLGAEHYKTTTDKLSYSEVFRELFTIARYEQHPSGVVDFKISPKIRTLLFDNELNETLILNTLLSKSFARMGIKPGDSLSTSQKQAVWLHFIKFQLSNYILSKLKPSSYNFSCKDAIDRGAVSSLYFHLHKSFTLNQAISRDEFERDLDIAAANVKGRGMNFHRRILWNAIDVFVNANYNELLLNKKKSWLISWRDMNCPHSRVAQLLDLRLKQYESQLNKLPPQQNKITMQGLKLLASVKMHYEQNVSGQRLLLEVISRSIVFLSENPSLESIKDYKNLAQELKINHPNLQIIAGLLLAFLGAVLFSKSIINQGISKMKTGFFVAEREELCMHIINIASEKEGNFTDDVSILSPSLNCINI